MRPHPAEALALESVFQREGGHGISRLDERRIVDFLEVGLTHSVSAGLDYALIGPEHAWLHDRSRAEYCSVSDREALDAAKTLARLEGIIPALESSHAVAEAIRRAPAEPDAVFIVNVSGRGDKDIDIYRENMPELDA